MNRQQRDNHFLPSKKMNEIPADKSAASERFALWIYFANTSIQSAEAKMEVGDCSDPGQEWSTLNTPPPTPPPLKRSFKPIYSSVTIAIITVLILFLS